MTEDRWSKIDELRNQRSDNGDSAAEGGSATGDASGREGRPFLQKLRERRENGGEAMDPEERERMIEELRARRKGGARGGAMGGRRGGAGGGALGNRRGGAGAGAGFGARRGGAGGGDFGNGRLAERLREMRGGDKNDPNTERDILTRRLERLEEARKATADRLKELDAVEVNADGEVETSAAEKPARRRPGARKPGARRGAVRKAADS